MALCTQFQNITNSNRLDLVAHLVEHWTSIPKVAGSIPTVIRQTFQLARCGCTLRVTSQTLLLKVKNFQLQHLVPTENLCRPITFYTILFLRKIFLSGKWASSNHLVFFISAYCDVTPYLSCYAAAWKECQRYGEKWSKKWAHEPMLIKIAAEIPTILAQHGSPVSKEGYTTWEKFLEVFLQRGMNKSLPFGRANYGYIKVICV